jgi:hypothetical protein
MKSTLTKRQSVLTQIGRSGVEMWGEFSPAFLPLLVSLSLGRKFAPWCEITFQTD